MALVGDSFVYGHLLDEDQSMAHHLRGMLGVRVATLAQPGAGPQDHLARVQERHPLTPKVIVVYTYENDVEDLWRERGVSEIRALIDKQVTREAKVFPREDILREADSRGRLPPLAALGRELHERLYVERLVEAVSASDGIIEAIRMRSESYVTGFQWHPEFHGLGSELLDSGPILDDFLAAAGKATEVINLGGRSYYRLLSAAKLLSNPHDSFT